MPRMLNVNFKGIPLIITGRDEAENLAYLMGHPTIFNR